MARAKTIEQLRQEMAGLQGQKAAIESQMEEVGEQLSHEVAVAYLAQPPEMRRATRRQQQPPKEDKFSDWGITRND